LAPSFEPYDLDVCNGHAASGEYHHHHSPACLAKRLNDSGTGHSPIYGFMVDGYPLYGPFQAKNTLAKSCWAARDYSSSSVTGCSGSKRCCTLNDPEDYTQGTTTVTCGPSLTGTTTSLSGNTISTTSGIYVQDYFYNSSCAARGGVYLDKHNGHSHGSYGYHYHVTISSKSSWGPVFPYFMGPKFYGCRSSGTCCGSLTSSSCSSSGSTCGSSDGTSTHACATGSWSGSADMDDVTTDDATDGSADDATDDATVSSSSSKSSGLSAQNKIIIIVVVTVVGGTALLVFVARYMFSSKLASVATTGDSRHPNAAVAMVEVKSGGRALV
jgi:hypothetical protein